MAAKSLHDLFVEELRDMYDGEKRITKALPKMAKAAESDELQSAFKSHLKETERQVTRLEEVFRAIGEKARGKKCEGITGIVEESDTAMKQLDGAVLDAALIAGAQKVEHYEIASYGTLAYFADMLGHRQAKALLGQTLEEEKATDGKLSKIAKSKVNRQALMDHAAEQEEAGRMFSTASRGRRGNGSMALAHERSSRRRSTGGASRRRGTRAGRSR